MKRRKRKYDEISYWESMADSMVGLLLCILLVMLLLILYLVRVSDDKLVDETPGDTYGQDSKMADGGYHGFTRNDSADEGDQDTETDTNDKTGRDSNSSGGGSGDNQFDDPDPGAGGGDGDNGSAVLVQVVDGETGHTIKQGGLEYELYSANAGLIVMSTYYPKKVDYKKFETDDTGVFYLPEKLALSSYYLHGLSAVQGYDTSEDTAFTIENAGDWKDPSVVTVSLYPSKNVIKLRLKDRDNGDAIPEATFDVVAAEDIVTQDGTVRYKGGDVVDTIEVDPDGYGESMELYLGNYLLRQNKTSGYYAKNTSDTAVEVRGKAETADAAVTEITQGKTAIKLTALDALYDTIPVAGAEFTLSTDDGTGSRTVKTDAKGKYTFTDLQKNTTYTIRQISAPSDYQEDTAEYSFTVSGDGLIEGEEKASLSVKNRLIRVSIGVRDRLFRGQISDVNVSLHDASDNTVRVWNTTGLEQTIEGLEPGEYRIVFDGKEDEGIKIVIEDKTELQAFQFDRFTTADIGALLAAGLVLIGIIILILVSVRRSGQKKAKGKE